MCPRESHSIERNLDWPHGPAYRAHRDFSYSVPFCSLHAAICSPSRQAPHALVVVIVINENDDEDTLACMCWCVCVCVAVHARECFRCARCCDGLIDGSDPKKRFADTNKQNKPVIPDY